MQTITKQLLTAYTETYFNVFNPDITIIIGERNELLNKLLLEHGFKEWAYITPYNPYSKVLSDEKNNQRYQELRKKIEGCKYFEGEGVGKDVRWKPERSFLILGISKEKATEIGKEYEQNAIVYGTTSHLPELLVLKAFEG